jgi:hypothetical protein
VTPVNDAPVITDVPDRTFNEDTVDTSLDLDNYVSDVDNTNAQLTWTASGSAHITASIDASTHVVTLTPAANWNGAETVMFMVCDPDGLCDTDNSLITISPMNDLPVISSVVVSPDPVAVNGFLTCSVTASDIDSTFGINYLWTSTNPGYSLAAFVGNNLNLATVAGETAGDIITCTATPYDLGGNGASASDSSTITGIALPACSNGLDDDSDSRIDYPNDPGCLNTTDNDETNPFPLPLCADGIDNDGDSLIDYPADLGCYAASDDNESNIITAPQCSDGIDNDGDLRTDYPFDAGCLNATDNDETNPFPMPQCADGADNDGDSLIDYPADSGCYAASDDNESNTIIIVNQPPVANAGADQRLLEGSFVTLNGAGSDDPDNAPNATLSYAWTQTAGPSITLAGANTVNPTFTAALPGNYTFQLIVYDGAAYSSANFVLISVDSVATSRHTVFALYNASGNYISNARAGENVYAVLSIDNMQDYPMNGLTSTLSVSGFNILGSSDGILPADNVIDTNLPPTPGAQTIWWNLTAPSGVGSNYLVSVNTEGYVNSQILGII